MSGFSEVFTTNPQTWVPKQIGKRVFSVHCSQLDHQKSISVTALQVVQSNKYTFLDFFPPLPLFWLAWLCSAKNIFFYIYKVWVYWWYYLDFNTCILHKIFDYDDFYLFRYNWFFMSTFLSFDMFLKDENEKLEAETRTKLGLILMFVLWPGQKEVILRNVTIISPSFSFP